MNSIALITKYAPKMFDEAYALGARCSVLDGASKAVEWVSAKTVRVPKAAFEDLGNYYRNNDGDPRVPTSTTMFGYGEGSGEISWEEFTIKADRAIAYKVEYFDNEESGSIAIGTGTDQINRTKVIPEIDSYCFSELVSYASTGLGNFVDNTTALTVDNIYSAIFDGINYLENNEVDSDNIVIFVSFDVYNMLRKANVTISRIIQRQFQGKLGFSVESIEGYELISVPAARFKTGLVLEDKGRSYAADSKQIDFIVVDKAAVLHIVKYNKLKILSGDIVLAGQGYDGYYITARVYHDLFVPDNKRVGLYAHVGASKAFTSKLDLRVNKNHVVTGITLVPGSQFARYYLSNKTETVGSKPDTTATLTPIAVGSDVSAGGDAIAVGADGKIIAKQTLTAAD